jgi:curved DNA-binding protein
MSYYDTLGVGKSASPEEIKSAYRKLAMKHQPDRGGDQKKFQSITEAYETLSDPDKKAFYDHGGGQRGNPFGGGFHEFHSGHPFQGGDPFGMGGHPFEDVFTHFGFGFQGSRPRPKNSDLQIKVKISLKDSYMGKTMTINYPLPSGRTQTAEITIPAGIINGQTMKMGGMGDDALTELPRGDLIINIDVDRDRDFYRDEMHLVTKLKIDIFDAMLGCKKTVKNIDDSEVEITINAGAQNGQKYACKGLGFPSIKFNNIKGDLIVQVIVDTPVVTDPELVSLVNDLANRIKLKKG